MRAISGATPVSYTHLVILDIPSEQERNERLIKFANVLSKEFGLKLSLIHIYKISL